MKNASVPTIIYLMTEIVKTAERILSNANLELTTAKERREKERFVVILQEVTVFEQIIKIANAIMHDAQKKKNSESAPLLLHLINIDAARMLHFVAVNKTLQKDIIERFKEADLIMNPPVFKVS